MYAALTQPCSMEGSAFPLNCCRISRTSLQASMLNIDQDHLKFIGQTVGVHNDIRMIKGAANTITWCKNLVLSTFGGLLKGFRVPFRPTSESPDTASMTH